MCEDYINGAMFEIYNVNQLLVWCFNQTYPARIEIDLSKVSVFQPFRIGNFEQVLPQGIFLHRAYDTQRKKPVCQFFKTPAWSNAQNRKVFEHRKQEIAELRQKREIQRRERGEDDGNPSLYDEILKQKEMEFDQFKSKKQRENESQQQQAAAKKKKVTKPISERPYPEHKLSSKDINKLKPSVVLTDKAGNPVELKQTSLTARPDVKLLSHKKLKEYRLQKLRRQNPNRKIEEIPPPENPFQKRVSRKVIKKQQRLKQQKEEQAKQERLVEDLRIISKDQKKRRENLLKSREEFLKQNKMQNKQKGIEFLRKSIDEDKFIVFEQQQKLMKQQQERLQKEGGESEGEKKDE